MLGKDAKNLARILQPDSMDSSVKICQENNVGCIMRLNRLSVYCLEVILAFAQSFYL